MHDIRFIRENPDAFDAALKRRNLSPASGAILTADADRRAAQTAMQDLQARRNDLSRQIGELKRKGENADAVMAEVAAIKEKMPVLEEQEKQLGARLDEILSSLPNIPAADVPEGRDEKDNKEIRKSGDPRRVDKPKQHFELGEALGLMDFENAAKLSGARFTILKGQLARLERALANFMLDNNTSPEFGYTEVSPPLMVRDEIMYGTGQLPKFKDDQFSTLKTSEIYPKVFGIANKIYKQRNKPLTEDTLIFTDQERHIFSEELEKLPTTERLWLIPTSEVPLTNIVNGDIIPKEKLPFRFTAKTPCFRAEAGAAGKDTRGMLRQHQFYKVEMVSITAPDQSNDEHERMTHCAETILRKLELPFRTVVLCTGDMGFSARKTYDIEVWMPGQNTYREISSCSNCGDFQARRMNARTRAAGEKNTEFVHTLNGSGLAVGRCLIAVMENFQEADGSISIPSALQPYMNGLKRIEMAPQ
ncbi:MAG: serine--tRNA ligase [Bdellovibrionales bacterium]